MEIIIFDGDFENYFFDCVIVDKLICFMDIVNNDLFFVDFNGFFAVF